MNARFPLLLVLSLCLFSGWGCRFRANATSPYVADADTSAGGADNANGSGGSDVSESGGQQNVSNSGGDQLAKTGGESAMSTGGSANEDASTVDADMPPEVDAGPICTPPTPSVCNPVTNVGCENSPGTQCAIDTLAITLAGYCILSAPTDAGTCANTGLSESCPPKYTCLASECRRMCFCDNECGKGECCFEFVGNLGFKVCKAC